MLNNTFPFLELTVIFFGVVLAPRTHQTSRFSAKMKQIREESELKQKSSSVSNRM